MVQVVMGEMYGFWGVAANYPVSSEGDFSGYQVDSAERFQVLVAVQT